MWDFPGGWRVPLAGWVDSIVNWLTVEGQTFFRAIGSALLGLLVRIESVVLSLPWVVIVAIFAYAAWRIVGPKLAAGVIIGMIFIGTLGMWEEAMITLALIISATIIATIIGIPLGILMSKNDAFQAISRPVLDLMQTMPSFVYLIPALMLFGLGKVPALISTFVYAVPPVIRLTNLGIRQVSKESVEAATAFGSTSRQLLFWVQIPLALNTIMAGVNQTIMMAVAMVVVASMIGAGGLGAVVLRGIQQLRVGQGFAGGISIVVLAIIIDRISQGLANREKAT